MLQESEGFGDSAQGGVPVTEMLSHSLGEDGIQPETRETGVTDCSSLRGQ